jgi:hypothetical protein
MVIAKCRLTLEFNDRPDCGWNESAPNTCRFASNIYDSGFLFTVDAL